MQLAPYNQEILDKVKNSIKAMEPITVLGMYDSGIDFLFSRLISEKWSLKYGEIIPLDWSLNNRLGAETLLVEKSLSNQKVIVIGYCGQEGLVDQSIFSWLQQMINLHRHSFSYVLWVNALSYEKLTSEIADISKVLTRNIVRLLPRDRDNTRIIISNYEERYDLNFTNEQIDKIIKYSCGVPGLIKALSLQIVNNSNWNEPDLNDAAFTSRLSHLASEYFSLGEENHRQLGYQNLDSIKDLLIKFHDGEKATRLVVELNLSPNEKKVWELLKQNSGQIITREQIATKLWADDKEKDYSDWALDQVISQLRDKLPLIDFHAKIMTKRGIGYVYTSDRK